MADDAPKPTPKVNRDALGRLLKGSVLNAGGRVGKRGSEWMVRLGELTHNGEVMVEGLVDIAKNVKHPDRFRALVYLNERWLGPLKNAPTAPYDDEVASTLAQAPDSEVFKLAAEVVAARKAEADGDQVEEGAVPDVGGAAAGPGQRGDGD